MMTRLSRATIVRLVSIMALTVGMVATRASGVASEGTESDIHVINGTVRFVSNVTPAAALLLVGSTITRDDDAPSIFKTELATPLASARRYDGAAKIYYSRHTLGVITPEGRYTVFVVKGKKNVLSEQLPHADVITVVGLSHCWKNIGSFEESENVWQKRLTARPLSKESCACSSGGVGATTCSYGCGGTNCQTSCSTEHYACCGCTPDSESREAFCRCCDK